MLQVSSTLVAISSLGIGGSDYWKVKRLISLTTLGLVPIPLGNVELELKQAATASSQFQPAIAYQALIDSPTISTSRIRTAEMELVALLELQMVTYTT